MRVAVFASGGGTNLQALLDVCRGDAPADIALVVSNTAGAGALVRAEKAGVAVAVLDQPANGEVINGLLDAHRIEFVVLAGYLKLMPPETVHRYAGRMVNIHPALLPSFGGPGLYGRRVHEAVLASGATVSGASVHLVSEEYDRGAIIAQWPVAVAEGDTPDTLGARVLEAEHQLLPAVVMAAARAGGKAVRVMPSGKHYVTSDTIQRPEQALRGV